jgi:LAO/AO transport system kinase
MPDTSLVALARGVMDRDRAAVAAALNLVEDRRASARGEVVRLLAALRKAGALEGGHRVGVTGPPGVGKSTLVAALMRELRRGGETVGVLAVDPSSVRSGGALLGDRTRIAPDPDDTGVFVRSLATAGELGGLAPSVPLGVLVLSAAFGVVVVETVGVGQSEIDVRQVVDTLVFVAQPGSGDALQYMKAGVMEVPDVLVVNKMDQDLAQRTVAELRGALSSLRAAGIAGREIPLVAVSARDGTGVGALAAALASHLAELASTGALAAGRRDGAVAWAMRAFVRRHGELGLARVGGEHALRGKVAQGIRAGKEVIEIIDGLLAPSS